jgi:hypothetical protein
MLVFMSQRRSMRLYPKPAVLRMGLPRQLSHVLGPAGAADGPVNYGPASAADSFFDAHSLASR